MKLFKRKSAEYTVVVYKKDLNVDLVRLLSSRCPEELHEFVFVLHSDASEEHYHVYLLFNRKVTKAQVQKLFFKTKCFVSVVDAHETSMGLLHYFTEGFRLPFETSYSGKDKQRINK